MIYKVSYLVVEADHPGAVLDQEKAPEVGDRVQLGDRVFEVLEVEELIPPMGEFSFLHVTCRPVEDEQ